MFFEIAQAGRRLACVENANLRSRDGLYIFASKRRDAAEPLDKIERDALAFEQGASRAQTTLAIMSPRFDSPNR